jgi:hypothetical protein
MPPPPPPPEYEERFATVPPDLSQEAHASAFRHHAPSEGLRPSWAPRLGRVAKRRGARPRLAHRGPPAARRRGESAQHTHGVEAGGAHAARVQGAAPGSPVARGPRGPLGHRRRTSLARHSLVRGNVGLKNMTVHTPGVVQTEKGVRFVRDFFEIF